MKKLFAIVVFIFSLVNFQFSFAQVKLPRLISDGMVLQRNQKINVWGWATEGEKVTITFKNKTYHTVTGKDGKWKAALDAAPAGGPYSMQINASNQIQINDILIGDVWICSGQSNMVLPMERVKERYSKEINNSENKFIRNFLLPVVFNFNEQKEDVESGQWISANPKDVLHFGAVSYFFAKDLYDKYKVPIGLINASVGGTPVEAWISQDALKPYSNYLKIVNQVKRDNYIDSVKRAEEASSREWQYELGKKDKGLNSSSKWYSPELNVSDWSVFQLPGSWNENGLIKGNGVVWLRKDFEVPASMAGKAGKLMMGRIVDSDTVYLNGVFVGTTSYQYPPRRYSFSANVLKPGKNTIVMRVITSSGNGGAIKEKPYYLAVDKDTIDLKGEWKAKVGAEAGPMPSTTFFQNKPTGLYNAMISPLINYRMKGVIWYQGESNVGRPNDYSDLFSTLINSWRKSWGQGNFPFLYVQLANFLPPSETPRESNWAKLREEQTKTLKVPNTAMAVTHDLGEWNDIHPLNKEDVGKRLALAAMKVAYGEKIVHSGPLYQSHQVKGNKVEISFSNVGDGLVIKEGDSLKQFAIAGEDKKFVWAEAVISNNKVIVWSEQIAQPKWVRYAWADNPEGANLYNKNGLPASSFNIGL